MLFEGDFVEGFLKLANGAGGDAMIAKLKNLVANDNALL